MIKANTCPYCDGPYTLDAGGCVAKCQDMDRHHKAVSAAAENDQGEAAEYEITPGMETALGLLQKTWRPFADFKSEGVRFIEMETLVWMGRAMSYAQQIERNGVPAGTRYFFRINDVRQ